MPSGASFAESPAAVRPVKEVQFGILGPEEIVSRAPLRHFCLRVPVLCAC